jgi:outer membrane protein TolC
MARDQLNLAKRALDDGQTHRADMLLIRARVDAELAQTLAQQTNTKNEADKVQTEVRELRAQLTEPRNPQPASATTETPPVPKVEDEDTVIED